MATKVDFIVIGNELLNGKISDRNTQELAKILNSNHLTLNQVKIIGDNKDQFNQALKDSLISSNIVITSGGLGPTKDDLTKKMLGDYFNRPLQESSDALTLAQEIYTRRGREYDKMILPYHILPVDFISLNNPIGFAPGLFYKDQEKLIFSTPGVPSEFKSMVDQVIVPIIEKSFKREKNISQFTVRTWKVPESKIFSNEIDNTLWEKLSQFGEVSSLPHNFGVDIGVALEGSEFEINQKRRSLTSLITNSPISSYVWQFGNLSLSELIVKEATTKNLTIGFAESCTGGLCASMITDISGASKVFYGSVISYSNSVKIKSLQVKEETLTSYGAVSEQTALEMAMGAKAHLEVDIAISTTGIAGPLGGSKDKPVGTVGIGFSTSKESLSMSKIYHFQGTREVLKQRFANKALITLLELIRKH